MRTSLPARVVAVWVALALTGAPAFAAHPGPGEHRCQCRAHAREDECECARCHQGRGKQDAAAGATAVPPCHRAAAKETDQAPPRPLAGRPCVAGYCGGPEQQATALTPLGAFTLPLALAPGGVRPPAGGVERPSGTERDAPSLPETPPPRADRAPADRA